MRKIRTFSGLLVAVLTIPCLSLPALAKKESGYLLTQFSDYWGPQKSYVTPTGLWVHSPKLGLTMFLKGPDWKVVCYNAKNKSYVTCSHKEWAEKFVGPIGARDAEKAARSKMSTEIADQLKKGVTPKVGATVTKGISVGGSSTICGRKAVQFFMVGAERFPPYDKNLEFWVVPNLNLKPPVIQAISEVGGFPAGVGLPIELYRHMPRGKKLTQYKTLNIEQVLVDDSIFSLPKGFTLAPDEMALVTDEKSSSKKGALEEVFGEDLQELDGLDPTSRTPKPKATR